MIRDDLDVSFACRYWDRREGVYISKSGKDGSDYNRPSCPVTGHDPLKTEHGIEHIIHIVTFNLLSFEISWFSNAGWI